MVAIKSATGSETRRTEGVRPRGRAERVVEAVLQAAAEELTRVGFAALRVEDVAARSGVNKTTIYRRWPTRAALVEAALTHAKPIPSVPDTGSLREEIVVMLRYVFTFLDGTMGMGLLRVLQTERLNPELAPVAVSLKAQHRAARIALFDRAIQRGELPKGSKSDVLADLVFVPILTKFVTNHEPIDETYVRSVIDIVLAGAGAKELPEKKAGSSEVDARTSTS